MDDRRRMVVHELVVQMLQTLDDAALVLVLAQTSGGYSSIILLDGTNVIGRLYCLRSAVSKGTTSAR